MPCPAYPTQNADFQYGGEGDWGTGVGLFYVFMDDMYSPILTTIINLEKTLNLDDGRAFVGITAATGDSNWQAHDILQWQFSSLYRDMPYTAPLIVNGEGAHECVNVTACVHQVDYQHYMRTNQVWGNGFDSAVGYQTGKEGYCSFC
jgi:Legume lectin domain